MARRHWAEVRKVLEKDLLHPSLSGRIRYFATRYRKAHDGYGRICVLVDGNEIINMPFKVENDRYSETHRLRKSGQSFNEVLDEVCDSFAQKGLFYPGDFGEAFDEFLSLDIQDALMSNNLLVRMFAVLDRRVGKRTLEKLEPTIIDLPEWLQYFYKLRFDYVYQREV